MSDHSSHTHINIHDEENYDPTVWVPKPHSHGTKALWRTFWILLFVTILDIVLYFSMDPGTARNAIFIIMGLVKAAFIVYVFMHLTYEKKTLKMSIVLPMLFVVYLILFLVREAEFWNQLNW